MEGPGGQARGGQLALSIEKNKKITTVPILIITQTHKQFRKNVKFSRKKIQTFFYFFFN